MVNLQVNTIYSQWSIGVHIQLKPKIIIIFSIVDLDISLKSQLPYYPKNHVFSYPLHMFPVIFEVGIPVFGISCIRMHMLDGGVVVVV